VSAEKSKVNTTNREVLNSMVRFGGNSFSGDGVFLLDT
jgi:hypothetical protein